MKWISYILFSFSIAFAQSIDEANQFLKSNELDKAIASYEKIILGGVHSHQVYYNLGIAYERKNKIGLAILNFEKANRLSPDNDLIQNQLDNLRLKTIDKPDIIINTGILKLFRKIQFSISYEIWGIFSIIFFFCIPLSIFLTYKSKSRLIFWSTFIWLSFGILCFSFARNSYTHYTKKEVIIINPTINIYSESNTESSILFTLHEGTKLEVISENDKMLEILYNFKQKGWIQNKHVQNINFE